MLELELKFRVYCNVKKDYIEQSYNGECFKWINEGVKNLTLEQYTGYKDVFNQDIYIGDLLEDLDHKDQGTVCFIQGAYCVLIEGVEWEIGQLAYTRIAGNVHRSLH